MNKKILFGLIHCLMNLFIFASESNSIEFKEEYRSYKIYKNIIEENEHTKNYFKKCIIDWEKKNFTEYEIDTYITQTVCACFCEQDGNYCLKHRMYTLRVIHNIMVKTDSGESFDLSGISKVNFTNQDDLSDNLYLHEISKNLEENLTNFIAKFDSVDIKNKEERYLPGISKVNFTNQDDLSYNSLDEID